MTNLLVSDNMATEEVSLKGLRHHDCTVFKMDQNGIGAVHRTFFVHPGKRIHHPLLQAVVAQYLLLVKQWLEGKHDIDKGPKTELAIEQVGTQIPLRCHLLRWHLLGLSWATRHCSSPSS